MRKKGEKQCDFRFSIHLQELAFETRRKDVLNCNGHPKTVFGSYYFEFLTIVQGKKSVCEVMLKKITEKDFAIVCKHISF